MLFFYKHLCRGGLKRSSRVQTFRLELAIKKNAIVCLDVCMRMWMWCGIFAMNGDEEKYPIYGWKGNGWQELHNTTLVSTVHASTYNIPVVVIQRRAQLFAVRASPLHHVEIQKKKIYFRPVNQCHLCILFYSYLHFSPQTPVSSGDFSPFGVSGAIETARRELCRQQVE